ncbi:response regulator transcription factor [Sulfurimonas sp. MAG313]|nr:response regulator transcription factor [Sulfurimonas sp. MAG313]MDF1880185.1 response regulator transcription factor [Sulfurimonas sp. MAG313]
MKILFLEDDPVIGNIVLDFLSEFYTVQHCFNSEDALAAAESMSFDLYIFDINVPGQTGLELLQSLREFNDTTPAIFITAYQELKYLSEGFKVGANDFIRKPFELEELQARVENIKRQYNIDESIVIDENCLFNEETHELIKEGESMSISAKESAVLAYLIKNKNRVVSSDELLQNLWSFDEMPGQDTIRTYIKGLRSFIGKEHIINIRGSGYRFE